MTTSLGVAQSVKDTLVVPEDSLGNLYARPELKDLNRTYNGEEFDYNVKTGESQNLIARFFNWLNMWLSDTFGIKISPEAFNVIQWGIYIVFSGLILYLIIRLLINERIEALFTKGSTAIADVELSTRHIEQVNLDELLSEALRNGEHRLAVRFLFLKLLQRLSQKQIIQWHFEKTNSDYQQEIQEPRLQSRFKELSYLYDYVWYGEQALDKSAFDKVRERFGKMDQLLP